ncbi:MAG TPA: MBL fold metallo-hydrolase [Bryobacteraceae bacterium]|jgi:beta-lactamase superfamily II metal-dependent hydrolase|nr:MBL fold metallo-hydrolase [Bryobacteraceae bacterium]
MRLQLPLALFLAAASLAAAADFRIYAIDVEGGKSTLYVSPSGESMLVDTGYDGFHDRDAGRILAAARDAGIHQIDYLVITHYHKDHAGGVPQLAAKIKIVNFLDHGENFEQVKDTHEMLQRYELARAQAKHFVVRADDAIPIHGIQAVVVTAAGKAIDKPLTGGGQPNPQCDSYKPIAVDTGENAHSIGLLMTYGAFRLVDLGDLYWNQEHDLACPVNKLGPVDVYMTTHHGKKTSGSPQMVWALAPKVAVMNNGPDTGGSEQAWQTIHDSPGFLDLWQLHFAARNDAAHNAPESMIANLKGGDQCQGNWIEITARQDGTFTVTNGRNQYAKSYGE